MTLQLPRKFYNALLRGIRNVLWLLQDGKIFRKELVLLDFQLDIPFSPSHGYKVTCNSDGMTLLNSSECLESPEFVRAYSASLQVNDWRGMNGERMDMRWRYYVVLHYANAAKELPGDFVECGVYKGGYSRAICEHINLQALNKTFYLFDTFEGLDPSQANQSEIDSGLLETYSGYDVVHLEALRETFRGFPVEFIKGSVPDSLSRVHIDSVAFLSIDMNMAAPEIAAANFFWDRISSGGVVLLDDYGFHAHAAQRKAFDEFAVEKKVRIFSLPTGQGVIIKS